MYSRVSDNVCLPNVVLVTETDGDTVDTTGTVLVGASLVPIIHNTFMHINMKLLQVINILNIHNPHILHSCACKCFSLLPK